MKMFSSFAARHLPTLGLSAVAAALMLWSTPPAHAQPSAQQDSVTTPRVFDVAAYGARCDGQSDDTAAIDAAQQAAAENGGGIITFPAGLTCVITRHQSAMPAVTITGDHLLFQCNGATLRAATVAPAATIDEELYFSSALKAVGRSDLTFENCNFDGRRFAARDPAMSFFIGVQTSGVQVRGGHFTGITNDRGAIFATSFDCRLQGGVCAVGGSNACFHDWTIERNRFEQSVVGMWIEESFENIRVVSNVMSKMDLSSYVTAPDDYGYSMPDGYGLGRYSLLRGIRFSGFTRAAPACDIRNVSVIGNEIEAALAIEIWNSSREHGRDGRRAHDIVVEGNTMHSLGGAWVNSFSKVEIRSNTWRRMALNAGGVTAYTNHGGIVHDLPDTSRVYGVGIEARPLTNYRVTGNVLDGGTTSGGSNEGAGFGIVIGAEWSRGDGVIADNTIRNSFIGIKANEVQGASIHGNRISGCAHALFTDFGQFPTDNPDCDETGNVFSGNNVEYESVAADSTDNLVFGRSAHPRRESWRIENNRIEHKSDAATVTAAIYFANPLGTYDVIGNTILGFRRYAIRDAALRTKYTGNIFDSQQSRLEDATVAPFRFDEQDGKSVTITGTTVRHCNTAATFWTPPGQRPARQQYDLGTFAHDGALKAKTARLN